MTATGSLVKMIHMNLVNPCINCAENIYINGIADHDTFSRLSTWLSKSKFKNFFLRL